MDIEKIMAEVIAAEAAAVASIQVTDQFEKAVHAILNSRGKVVTTGIGKAGLAARKLAATLCSTTTPAVYVHPAEASHGDLGIIGANDALVVFSTSGKSNEIIEMVKLAGHLDIGCVISVTSHPDSPLRDLSDITIDMGTIAEPCPLGLTPSASIAVMLAIGDAIALALMSLKGVTREQYGLRHHGGYLGRKARTDNS